MKKNISRRTVVKGTVATAAVAATAGITLPSAMASPTLAAPTTPESAHPDALIGRISLRIEDKLRNLAAIERTQAQLHGEQQQQYFHDYRYFVTWKNRVKEGIEADRKRLQELRPIGIAASHRKQVVLATSKRRLEGKLFQNHGVSPARLGAPLTATA